MRTVPQAYATGADGNIRNVNVTIKDINDSVLYTASQILSVSIQKSVTDGSVGIGFTQSDRLFLQVISDRKIPKMTWLRVYISIDGSPDVSFGRFVTEECVRDGSAITITAFDAMYYQSAKTVKFTGAPSLHLEPLSFPCSMQDMLDYICTLRNMTTEFTCQSFTVQQMPQKGENQYYSVRELIGFIAACHGCNAKLDASNHLVFKQFETVNYSASAADVLDLTIDDSEPFEITGVLFTVDDETSIYIDDVPGSEYDEDDVGVISCYNPLATVEIAEYVWTQIGGLSYYGGSLTQRGKGIIEVGDVITTGNLKYPADTETYPLCVTTIDYSISPNEGFIETIGSEAAKSSDQMSSGTNGSSGGAGTGTGKFLDAGHTSVAHNDTLSNTSQGLYDSVDGYKNTLTGAGSKSGDEVSNGCNTVTGQHNTVAACTDDIVAGEYNVVVNCQRSIITGLRGRYIDCYGILGITNGNATVYNASRSLLIGEIASSAYLTSSCICVDAITVTASQLYNSAIFGTAHSINGNCNYVGIFGHGTTVSGTLTDSIIAGSGHTVQGDYNAVTGAQNDVSGNWCAVFGRGNKVRGNYKMVIGQYGEVDTSVDVIFAVGGGTSASARANVFEIDDDGDVYARSYNTNGADYAEFFEWLDGNPDNEDRRGMLVNLDGDKIVPAHGNEFIGVISANPSVIGNSAERHWHGKYKTDVFGQPIKDEAGKPIISDDYKKQRYIPRSERPEWAVVGLVGRLIVTDDGSCKVGGSISARNGIATSCYTGSARVLKRIDEHHIEVLIK